ncbi:CubicO group peptidase, beta-lactamase class C family [Mucilaginibacter pineti]|uniref:CubicO group peptidase, beta-lactamase class C family n=1 Tax=Mucilaginibacter pineti TaxID=1391627 RepID=A0A1G7ELU1_9SPHI|nr:serine hydrolase domain-containing protein [Mucilaginibacter pineti]SDE64567.1 CubicO group peptidase, beta-lactamase class C family [Mucilaginibacter pineti]
MKRFLIVLMLVPVITRAQQLPDSLISKIDVVLSRWKSTGPGCAVSVVMGDHIVYSKGFGLANVEYNIPVTPETVFTLASVSKEFTGYAITLLVKQGKVSLDDDIRKYLPWLSEFKHKITVANLLHHTSGLRDHLYLLNFTGFPMDGILTQEYALNIIKKEKTLDFLPGEKFYYCNANYVLLAEIIERASGKSFAAFADSAIFRPLGMHHTRIQQNPFEVIKDHAASYSDDQGHVTTFPLIHYEHGDGGVLSSANDLAKWTGNFYRPKAGNLSDIANYTALGQLNNGKRTEYGSGVFANIHRGQKRLMHKGGIAGYKNFIAVYPELKIGIVVLTNADDGPKTTATMEDLAALLVPEGKLTDPAQEPLIPVAMIDSAAVKTFTGEYVAHNGEKIHFKWKKGKLFLDGISLSPAKGNVWYAENYPAIRYRFGGAVNPLQVETPGPNPPVGYHKIKTSPKALSALKAYCGTYTTDEVDYSFTISIKKGKLVLTNHRHGQTPVTLYGADDLYPGFYFIDHLVAVRNKKGYLTGLELAQGVTSGLIFHKATVK